MTAPDDAADRPEPIAHEALTAADLPRPRDPFEDVVAFAATFDGYAHFGMEECAAIGNRAVSAFLAEGRLPDGIVGDLDRLRGALFFEARRWLLLEQEPNARVLLYVHALLDAVRDVIRARSQARALD